MYPVMERFGSPTRRLDLELQRGWTPSVIASSLASACPSQEVTLTRQPSPPRVPGLGVLSPHRLLSSVVRSGVNTIAAPRLPYGTTADHAGRAVLAVLGALEQGCSPVAEEGTPHAAPPASHSQVETDKLLVAAAARLNRQETHKEEPQQQEARPAHIQPSCSVHVHTLTLPLVSGSAALFGEPNGAGSGSQVPRLDGWTPRRSGAQRTASLVMEPPGSLIPAAREKSAPQLDRNGTLGPAGFWNTVGSSRREGHTDERQGQAAAEALVHSDSRLLQHQGDERAALPPLQRLRFGSTSFSSYPADAANAAQHSVSFLTSVDAASGAAVGAPLPYEARVVASVTFPGHIQLPDPPEQSTISYGSRAASQAKLRVRLQGPHSPPSGHRAGAGALSFVQRLSERSSSPPQERSDQRCCSMAVPRPGLFPSIAHTLSQYSNVATTYSLVSRGGAAPEDWPCHSGGPGTVDGGEAGEVGPDGKAASGSRATTSSAAHRKPVPYSAAESPILTTHNLPTRASHVGTGPVGSAGHSGGPTLRQRSTELGEQLQQAQPPLPALPHLAPPAATATMEEASSQSPGPRARAVSVQDHAEPFSLRRSVYCDWVESEPLEERLAPMSAPVAGLGSKTQVLRRQLPDRAAPVYYKPANQKPLLGADVLHVL